MPSESELRGMVATLGTRLDDADLHGVSAKDMPAPVPQLSSHAQPRAQPSRPQDPRIRREPLMSQQAPAPHRCLGAAPAESLPPSRRFPDNQPFAYLGAARAASPLPSRRIPASPTTPPVAAGSVRRRSPWGSGRQREKAKSARRRSPSPKLMSRAGGKGAASTRRGEGWAPRSPTVQAAAAAAAQRRSSNRSPDGATARRRADPGSGRSGRKAKQARASTSGGRTPRRARSRLSPDPHEQPLWPQAQQLFKQDPPVSPGRSSGGAAGGGVREGGGAAHGVQYNQFEESMLQIALARSAEAESIKYWEKHQEELLADAHSRWVVKRRHASEQRERQGGLNPARPMQTSPVFIDSTLLVIMFGSPWLNEKDCKTLDQVCSKTALLVEAEGRAMGLRASSSAAGAEEP